MSRPCKDPALHMDAADIAARLGMTVSSFNTTATRRRLRGKGLPPTLSKGLWDREAITVWISRISGAAAGGAIERTHAFRQRRHP